MKWMMVLSLLLLIAACGGDDEAVVEGQIDPKVPDEAHEISVDQIPAEIRDAHEGAGANTSATYYLLETEGGPVVLEVSPGAVTIAYTTEKCNGPDEEMEIEAIEESGFWSIACI